MTTSGITVFGATGYTGRLVVQELVRQGIQPAVAGRQADKLARLAEAHGNLEQIVADVNDPESLAAMAQRSRVIINCAGPFMDYGPPVVAAAVEQGAHYLDTTGEQPFMKEMLRHDEQARERGVAVVSSQAFEVAVTDCAAAIAAEGFRDIAAVEVFYNTVFHASQGTQRSVVRMLQRTGYVYKHGDWVAERPGRIVKRVDLPPPLGNQLALSIPSAEVMTIPRHLKTRQVQTYFLLSPLVARGAALALPWLQLLARTPLGGLLYRGVGSGTSGPTEDIRAGDEFQLVVEVRGVRNGRAARQRVLLTGRDPYGLTAVIIVAAARRMLDPSYDKRGVLPPAAAFDPREVLRDGEALGLQWQLLEDETPTSDARPGV